MKVLGLKTFVAVHRGTTYLVRKGEEVDAPEGVDWVHVGLAEKVEKKTVKRRGSKSEDGTGQ